MFFKRDKDFPNEFEEDSEAIGTEHHRENNIMNMIDTSKDINGEIMSFYRGKY